MSTKNRVLALQQEAAQSVEKSDSHDEELFLRFQQKEARLLEAAAEDHRNEMNLMQGELEGKLAAVQRQLLTEQAEQDERNGESGLGLLKRRRDEQNLPSESWNALSFNTSRRLRR